MSSRFRVLWSRTAGQMSKISKSGGDKENSSKTGSKLAKFPFETKPPEYNKALGLPFRQGNKHFLLGAGVCIKWKPVRVPTRKPAFIASHSNWHFPQHLRRGGVHAFHEHHAQGHQSIIFYIQPENILMDRKNIIKLADFGFAARKEQRNTVGGTCEYMAPEMFSKNGYDYRIDIWALGILLYELIEGRSPFHGKKYDEIMHLIQKPISYSKRFRKEEIALISSILRINPNERP